MKTDIDTPSKRARLLARKNPYWQGVSGGRGGVSLGYRKTASGQGAWIAKIVLEGRRIEERLGSADDDGAPSDAVTYRAAVSTALEWSRRQHAALERAALPGAKSARVTVRSAVMAHAAARKRQPGRARSTAEGRLTKHVLSDEDFASLPLAKLKAAAIVEWRNGLADHLAPATVNRILNDLRAALNAAAESHRNELPSRIAAEIKIGTKALSIRTNTRKQLLTDAELRKVIAAAFEIDADGDFGRLVLLAATTGARFSQLAALTVEAVQPELGRILIPGSHKGRAARQKAAVAVPVSAGVIEQLALALDGRGSGEPLLQRWAYKRISAFKWTKEKRAAWTARDEVDKPWRETVARAGVPADTIMYSLRHSSIVRGLRAGLPVRLIAALHDTSSEMIEAHYSAYIVDATEELSQRNVLAF
jgi:integrase